MSKKNKLGAFLLWLTGLAMFSSGLVVVNGEERGIVIALVGMYLLITWVILILNLMFDN